MSASSARGSGPGSPAHSEFLGLVAGGVTFAAVAGASGLVITRLAIDGEAGLREALHLAALSLFALAFFPVSGPWSGPQIERVAPWALLTATLAATVAVVTFPQVGMAPVLYILTAALAAHVVHQRTASWLIAGQTSMVLLSTLSTYPEPLWAVVQTIAYGGFQVFALTTTLALLTERTLRRRLALANAELSGTRALLDSASRQGERLRIARDLHDLVGHHLTALSLHLEVADHLVEGRGREPVERARAIARLLLADVREVVSDLRDRELDLTPLLQAMVAELPRPRVMLDLPDTLTVDDGEQAQVVLRLVQEALTNAVRHGHADQVWIRLRRERDNLVVEARDDGRGTASITPGNGLRGMLERVHAAGGELELTSAPGQGFTVRANLPLPRGT